MAEEAKASPTRPTSMPPFEPDSPAFTLKLMRLRQRLRGLVSGVSSIVKAAKEYCDACDEVAACTERLAEAFKNVDEIGEIRLWVADGFLGVGGIQRTLAMQLRDLLMAPNVAREEMAQLAELEKTYQAVKNELRESESRLGALKRGDVASIHSAETRYVSAVHSNELVRFDYFVQLQLSYENLRALMMQEMAAMHYAHLSSFKQSHGHLTLMEPLMFDVHNILVAERDALDAHASYSKQTREKIRASLKTESTTTNNHNNALVDHTTTPIPSEPAPELDQAGYLYLITPRSWRGGKRRWVTIRDGILGIHRPEIKFANQPPRSTVHLMLAAVREGRNDVPHTFEVVSQQGIIVLRAPTEDIKRGWMQCIQANVAHQLNHVTAVSSRPATLKANSSLPNTPPKASNDSSNLQSSPSTSPAADSLFIGVDDLRLVPGNDRCADCNSPFPEWASINLGILLCIECSGVHRSLGTHISKVRSLKLDTQDWDLSLLRMMRGIGNKLSNESWERSLHREAKPIPSSLVDEKRSFIQLKYVHKTFVAPQNRPPEFYVKANKKLVDGAKELSLPLMVDALATGATINILDPETNQSALHIVCNTQSPFEPSHVIQSSMASNLVSTSLGWGSGDHEEPHHVHNGDLSDDDSPDNITDDDDKPSSFSPLTSPSSIPTRFTPKSPATATPQQQIVTTARWGNNDWRASLPSAATQLKQLQLIACLQFLVLNGADIRLKDTQKGWSALFWAVNNDNLSISEFLLERDPTLINERDCNNCSVLHIARDANASRCLSVLQIAYANQMAMASQSKSSASDPVSPSNTPLELPSLEDSLDPRPTRPQFTNFSISNPATVMKWAFGKKP